MSSFDRCPFEHEGSAILTCMNFRMLILLIMCMGAVGTPEPDAHKQTEIVSFPVSGRVLVTATVGQGQNPTIKFRSVLSGKLLLQSILGDKNWKEIVVKDDPLYLSQSIGFISIHHPVLPNPLIVALTKRAGGSDCSYTPALFGEVNGAIHELTPPLPDYYTRGSIFLSAADGNSSPKLTITSERYNWEKDVHYTGPSAMEVFRYTFKPEQGHFALGDKRLISTDQVALKGDDLMKLFGAFRDC